MINSILIRRAAWTLFSFCLAVSLAADAYHPHILKSQVVTLDTRTIETNAQNGTPFELVFGDTYLNVVLTPEPVWPKDGLPVLEVDRDGVITQRIVKGNITYAGEVVGEDPAESEARFTIANGVLEGYVISETGWWFIEPLSRFDPKAGPEQYLGYATRDTDFVLEYPDDGWNDEIEDPTPPHPGNGDGRIPVVMVADRTYATYAGSSPYEARHATLVNSLNGIFQAQAGRQFRIEISIADFGDSFLTFTNAPALLVRLKLFLDFAGGGPTDLNAPGMLGLTSLNGYFAHLTTARNLDGNTLNHPHVTSRFGLSQQALIPLGSGESGVTLGFQNMMLAAHTFGHNFNGVHGEADRICVDDGWFGCDDYRRTIMWPTFYSDNFRRFSNGLHDPTHNNAKRIRDFMTGQGF